MQEENPVRGYFSSVDRQLIFGLGKNDHVDSLQVIWPDDKRQLIKNFDADTTSVLSWKNARNQDPVKMTNRNGFLPISLHRPEFHTGIMKIPLMIIPSSAYFRKNIPSWDLLLLQAISITTD